MLRFLRTLLSYSGNIFVLIILFPPFMLLWLITLPFDREKILLHYFNCFYASSLIAFNPTWSINFYGRKNYRKGKTYIMIANHQSYADIFAINQLYRNFKWISKQEVYKLPIVGWVLFLTRYITLKRENKYSIAKMYKRCSNVLDKGISIVMFPEGTRSIDGNIHRFKTGAAKVALENKRPILPIVLKGSHKAYPNEGFHFTPRVKIIIKVLPEIQYNEFKHLSTGKITKMVEELIKNEFNKL